MANSDCSYQGEIVLPESLCEQVIKSKDTAVPVQRIPVPGLLCEIYASADLYQLPGLKNAAIDALRSRLKSSNSRMAPSLIAQIYRKSHETSLLRTLTVDLLAWNWIKNKGFGKPDDVAKLQSVLVTFPELGTAVMSEMSRLYNSDTFEDPKEGKGEKYHEVVQ